MSSTIGSSLGLVRVMAERRNRGLEGVSVSEGGVVDRAERGELAEFERGEFTSGVEMFGIEIFGELAVFDGALLIFPATNPDCEERETLELGLKERVRLVGMRRGEVFALLLGNDDVMVGLVACREAFLVGEVSLLFELLIW